MNTELKAVATFAKRSILDIWQGSEYASGYAILRKWKQKIIQWIKYKVRFTFLH